ncbi:4-hydroxybenzoate polyprenyltransferase [Halogranum gelatinilyticum]|uniref:4-hydroxybenzoate polyprenyltransferase n=1 Tax=Halogranum gelatinilyticum TaxID=660521 RepID=A0A1G9ULM8_9EURY|nr:prenyltransferase [Halogranum gelatinilyticum]SDM60791.1 4-hydroxybenzoate polyprenyltransferase [Halogranum gelatinilyticum]
MTGLRYLLKLSRPRFWLYLAGPVVVGVAFAAETPSDLFAPVAVALFAYFLLPANVLLYGVNDVFDADVDEANPKKDEKEVRYGGGLLVPAAVVASGLLGLATFAITPPVAWPWLAGFFVLGVQYSAPPLRFKTTPFLDSVSNGLYILPGVAAYAALAGTNPPLAAVAGGWLWTMGMHTFSAIPDIEPDREAGIRTTATYLGESRTYWYCAACWLAAAVAFGTLDWRAGALLLAYPVAVFAIVRSSVDVARAYWWYPALNTVVGMVMTLGGLWEVVYG